MAPTGSARRTFERLAAAAERERAAVAARPGPEVTAELERLRLEEIHASVTLAGARLRFEDVATLVATGRTGGAQPLDAYVIAADYADAARFATALPLPGRKQRFLRVEEIVDVHARATRRTPAARPGAWRDTTAAPLPSGMVPLPPWSIPNEMTAYVERVARGPADGASPLLWAAAAHERFERIRPFTAGNGRAGRLLANLLLRRCGFPPFAVRGTDGERYLAALQRADGRELWPLAALMARSVLASLSRLAACASLGELRELRAFAEGSERDALYKAAQRGRLQTVRRGGSLMTTHAWVDAYRASRRPRGAEGSRERA